MGRLPAARNKHKPWTRADDDELRRMHALGMTHRQMCKPLFRTERGVTKRVSALGLEVITHEWRWWTTAEVRRLEQLRQDGYSITEVAEALGRTWASVWHKCRERKCGSELNSRSLRTERWVEILCNPHTIAGACRKMQVKPPSVVSARLRLKRLEYPVVMATSMRWPDRNGKRLTAASG